MTDGSVQKVWGEALRVSEFAWQVRSSQKATQDEILTLLKEAPENRALMSQVMQTPIGNWVNHPQRAALWPLVSGAERSYALSRTAAGWIEKIADQSIELDDFSPEVELLKELADTKYEFDLSAALLERSYDQALDVFVSNKFLKMQLFCNVLFPNGQINNQMVGGSVERTARLVKAREWKSVTRRLYNQRGVTLELKPYFSVCAEHLSMWERMWAGVSTPTRLELYGLLHEVAASLYPRGLADHEVWPRAGGDLSRMQLNISGSEQWANAIRQIRLGGSQVDAKSLISIMTDDYPHNARLSQLSMEFR